MQSLLEQLGQTTTGGQRHPVTTQMPPRSAGQQTVPTRAKHPTSNLSEEITRDVVLFCLWCRAPVIAFLVVQCLAVLRGKQICAAPTTSARLAGWKSMTYCCQLSLVISQLLLASLSLNHCWELTRHRLAVLCCITNKKSYLKYLTHFFYPLYDSMKTLPGLVKGQLTTQMTM